MFTGIIEAVGTLAELRRGGEDMALTVHAPTLDFSDVKLGDSIATNGVCLTVVALGDLATPPTSPWKPSPHRFFCRQGGDPVNLEGVDTPPASAATWSPATWTASAR